MRKVTNLTVATVVEAIKQFKGLFTAKAPFKLNYAILKHEKPLQAHFIDYTTARIALCDELCKKDEAGKAILTPIGKDKDGNDITSYKFSDENMVVFNQKLTELNNIEVEVPDFQVSLEDMKEFAVEPGMLPLMSPFLEYFVKE